MSNCKSVVISTQDCLLSPNQIPIQAFDAQDYTWKVCSESNFVAYPTEVESYYLFVRICTYVVRIC